MLNKTDKPKLFHSYIRQKKVGRPRIGPLRLVSGQLVSDGKAMAQCLAESFSSVYTTGILENAAPHQLFSGNLDTVNITPDTVCSILNSLEASSAMGSDEVSPLLLKKCCSTLAFPLTMLFRESLEMSLLPELWKQSLVVPIFKKGVRADPLNYRPISLTSVVCKVLERVIYRSLYLYLEDNGVLSADQFGFRAGRSTEDQLLLVYDKVTRWMDEGQVVDVVLFDFAGIP